MIITSGKYKGQKIIAPNEKITRPTLSKVRMSVFNILYSIIGDFEDKSFLDVFGGSGIIGLEAISRGFRNVQVFEINKSSALVIKKNYENLGLKANLKIGNSVNLLENLGQDFDVIYVDPPYESKLYDNILTKIKKGIIIVEHTGNVDFQNFSILKQKKYGSTFITFLENLAN